jgi:glutathione S-transferase
VILMLLFHQSYIVSLSCIYPRFAVDIEGAAEQVRLALDLAGIPFEDDRITFPDWPALKPTTPYGQVPLLSIDGGNFKSQTGAQLRYVASIDPTSTLYSKDKIYEIEECIGLVQDMTGSWAPSMYLSMMPSKYGYPEDYAKTPEGLAKIESMRKDWVAKQLPVYLSYLEAKLEKNGGKFLCGGDKPSLADCVAVPVIRSFTRGHVDFVDVDCVKKCSPKVVAYVERFCALAEVKGRYTDGIGSS